MDTRIILVCSIALKRKVSFVGSWNKYNIMFEDKSCIIFVNLMR